MAVMYDKQQRRGTWSAKTKSVTFTGCWTCRSRKVKCDERQRNGCGVCERLGLACAGYGVSLSWVTGRTQQLQGQRRRRIKPDPIPLPILSDQQISTTLSSIDAVFAPSGTITDGPFAVFQAYEPIIEKQSLVEPVPLITVDIETQVCGHPPAQDEVREDADLDNLDTPWETLDTPQPTTTAGYLDTKELHSPELSSEVGAPTVTTYTEWDSNHVPASGSPRPELLRAEISQELEDPGASSSSPHLGLSIPLSRDAQTSMLLHHYVNHVAELLQPVLHPKNPWRTTYFPFALAGRTELALCQEGATPSTFASTALFHGLVSAAAFHLRNATNGSTEFHQLGLQHRIKALRALNATVVSPDDPLPHTIYLTAMLSLVTIDTVTGEDSDYPIHLEACRQLQEQPRYYSTLEDSSRQVNSIFRILSLLARTTAPVKPRPCPPGGPALDLQWFDDGERSIEYIYGITPALGSLLQRTCEIAEYLEFYRDLEEQPPAALVMACHDVRDELSAWAIDSEPFRLIQSRARTMLEIARCQARAFHGAVLIFYHRIVQSHTALRHEVDIDSEVRAICENLTVAEDLKDAYMGGVKRIAPMSWPAFIAACEATDRRGWIEWWERVQGYRLGNLARQWRIIQELWSVMDANETVTNWKDALRRTGERVLPI
ncbi:hypothetical protein GQ53DRAFT_506543 [Thozetella sp. PMI_491]|nr:hypothetical protein GQ53DRAFT_506543 [Thozetella sp. PMI_491]